MPLQSAQCTNAHTRTHPRRGPIPKPCARLKCKLSGHWALLRSATPHSRQIAHKPTQSQAKRKRLTRRTKIFTNRQSPVSRPQHCRQKILKPRARVKRVKGEMGDISLSHTFSIERLENGNQSCFRSSTVALARPSGKECVNFTFYEESKWKLNLILDETGKVNPGKILGMRTRG